MVCWPDPRRIMLRLARRGPAPAVPPGAPCTLAVLRAAVLLCLLLAVCATARAGSVLERVHATRTLRVCLSLNDGGITYRDPRTGEARGIDVDLSAAFAADLDAQLVTIDTSIATFTADLLANRCDIAMLAVAATPARRALLRFSRPYLTSGVVGIASRGSEVVSNWNDIDQPGVRVGVQRGSQIEPLLRQTLKHASVVVLDGRQNREDELLAGRLDVLLAGLPYAYRLLENADWARVVAPPKPFHPMPYAYAVRPGDDAWLATVDAFVARIQRDGRLAAAARRHHLTEVTLLQ
ncbi:ABC transporter substrate-binding protein [Burkholderia glumae]|uniref:ABC transporter substrate-binding protein n=2 Tax=Burkholderia glumae TaxID=337 RepID=A0AAP9Y0J2_BURGL|nr:ABC transporter substrate-binding protein [Burkholderia glumae]ACR32558.1 family 3 extracellular solute-binding protein [Burkholderia glumae BGR1]AJY62775.1 bacterial extracellular solute-binding s, 3 family protein [Burkholderia glumae LMG 2196 = ATCC 33617]KHJ60594.1 amino acid ABC transporter substrate-binding protein [Burkholderia glumae]MCM2484235.1 ABC transporter substrate-binding protein [Burkholderia glumae]MCM2494630.1 ABC transporter substrate-binding protein [Burkholderia glumae